MSSWIAKDFFETPPPKRRKSNSDNKSKSKLYKSDLKKALGISDNWIENFDPQTEVELAVHSKKIKEVKDWICNTINCANIAQVLLITGPAGAGKTATVKVLCKDLGLTINEWINPMDIKWTIERDRYGGRDICVRNKQSDLFMEYILKASRYNSLFEQKCKGRLVLVEDFPNYILKDPSCIETILSKYKLHGKAPLVFICTDSVGQTVNIKKNIFTEFICRQYKIDNISFNPVSVTSLKSALNRAISIMPLLTKNDKNYFSPNSETIEAIIHSSMGDIRSCLNNLLFSTMKDFTGSTVELEPVFHQLPWILTTPRGSRKSRPGKLKTTKLKNFGRDETLSLLHGVGRVLNPKRIMCNTSFIFSHPVNETLNSFISMHKVFINFLHRNYLSHFHCVEDINPATEYLSMADVLCVDYMENDSAAYALWLSIGALQVFNMEPTKSWAPVRAPIKMEMEIPNCEDIGLGLNNAARKRIIAIDYKTYCSIIMSKRNAEEVTTESENDEIEIEDFSD